MKNYFLFIFLLLFLSCKQEKTDYPIENIADIYYKKAKGIGKDSAFYYFNLAKNSYLDTQDSSGVGRSLVNMAILQHDKGDYYGSIETSLEANKYLRNVKDSIIRFTLGSSYNNMGICSSYLYEFDNSVKFYKKALKYVNDAESNYLYHNNLGDVLTTLGEYKQAQQNFKMALQTKRKINYAKALNNSARAKYNEDPNYDALPELYKALKIRQEEKDSYGENSSYATISNYFLTKDKSKALYYAKKMLDVAIKNNSGEDQLQALQKIINLDKENYLKYFGKFQTLNDSIQISRSKAKNQFAVVRYDVEQKNAENKTLKLQDAKNKIDILHRNIGLAISGIILIGGNLYYKKRKERLEREKELLKQEKEIEVKNTELKYSKKVHDKVANKVYHVMSEVENIPVIDKDELLDKLESIYHISRDISYDDKELTLEKDFSKQLSIMLKSYSSEIIKIPIIGNEENLWSEVSETAKIEVFYILQELMTNMKKHSRANRVMIDFERKNNRITILYSDNGVGIHEHIPKNGLKNTESRINSINGTINFETQTEKGLKINLSFPVKK